VTPALRSKVSDVLSLLTLVFSLVAVLGVAAALLFAQVVP